MRTPQGLPKLSALLIGEPDANIEHEAAQRRNGQPIYEQCFFDFPRFPTQEFVNGSKYFLVGQKGTGKTAVLRSLMHRMSAASENSASAICEYVIFKKSILEEGDIIDVSQFKSVVDEDKIHQSKHYYHALKRLILSIILAKISSFSDKSIIIEEDSDADKSFLAKIKSGVSSAISAAIDSVSDIMSSVRLDAAKVSAGAVSLEAQKLIKRSNDTLLKRVYNLSQEKSTPVRIFFDEIHFAYRDSERLAADAMLVRDLILVVQFLNQRFFEDRRDITIYCGIRSEFLEHPIIHAADVSQTIESLSFQMNWSTFSYNKEHPLFSFISNRLRDKSTGIKYRFENYMANINKIHFLEHTWAKPRDFVRFFRCAQQMFPDSRTVRKENIKTILNEYSRLSWKEVQSATTAFLPATGLCALGQVISGIAPSQFDGSRRLSYADFSLLLRPVYDESIRSHGMMYNFDHFMHILYIMGVYYTKKMDANRQWIIHSYHRGNRSPQPDGIVELHRAVLLGAAG